MTCYREIGDKCLAKIPQDMGGLTIKTKDLGGGQATEQKQWTRHGPIESSYSARSYYNNCTLNSTDLREGRWEGGKTKWVSHPLFLPTKGKIMEKLNVSLPSAYQ